MRARVLDPKRLRIRHRRSRMDFALYGVGLALAGAEAWYDDFSLPVSVWAVILTGIALWACFNWTRREVYLFDLETGRAIFRSKDWLGERKISLPLASLSPRVEEVPGDDPGYRITLSQDGKFAIPLEVPLESQAEAQRCAYAIEDFLNRARPR